MTEYEFDTPEALLINAPWSISPLVAAATRQLFENSFQFGPPSRLVDQFGRPVKRTWAPPKIGQTLSIRKPQRFTGATA